MTLSPEQARGVLREMLGGVMTNHHGLDKDAIVFINERVLFDYVNAVLAEYLGEPELYMAKNLHSNSYATHQNKAECELYLMQSGLKNDGAEAAVLPLYAPRKE